VYKNTLATVKRQILQAENPIPAIVISMEPVRVDNAILLGHLTFEVVLKRPGIGSTDPNIQTNNTCTDDKLHIRIPRGYGDYQDEGDKGDEWDTIATGSHPWQTVTELTTFALGTRDVISYLGDDGNNVGRDEQEEALQANDASTQKLEDWGPSTTECQYWTV